MTQKVQVIENELVIFVEKRFDLSDSLDLRGTGITALPDNLSVGGSLYKDFD